MALQLGRPRRVADVRLQPARAGREELRAVHHHASADGKVTYRIQRQVNNVNTNLASATFPVALQPGTWYWTRFEVVGEQFRARTLPDGGENESTTWDMDATDPHPSLTHGSVGVREQSVAGNKNLARLDVRTGRHTPPEKAPA